jgi:hypothetical protein
VATENIIPVLLLALLGFSVGTGLVLLGWMLAVRRREVLSEKILSPKSFFAAEIKLHQRPTCWLAIRAVSPEAVKAALGLNRATPCSWAEGLSGSREFFISPRVHGWVIVTGLGLPHPGDDVDATFLFLTSLSRKLGHVQFFHADRVLLHHAWARLDDGCVTRAFAWTGETVWNQGKPTLPELETGLNLPDYGEFATDADIRRNLKKFPQLAARWSLDPAEVKLKTLRESIGIAGESAPF